MSFKAEVIADASGQWCSNGLRFATEQDAKIYVDDLMMRWTAVRDTRVVQCSDPVTVSLDIDAATKTFKIVFLSSATASPPMPE